MADRSYTIGDIVAQTGVGERSVLMWADALAIRPDPGTNRAGRGVHRQFQWREVEVAAVLAAVAPFRLPIGVLCRIGTLVHNLIVLGEPPQWLPDGKIAEAARRGERVELVLFPNNSAAPGDEPFAVSIRWPAGLDDVPVEEPKPLPKAAIIIDLGECWKELRP